MGGLISGLFAGGPSTAMRMDASQQKSLADSLFANYNERYADQTQMLNQLRSSYAPIISAGPGQQGFTSPVLASLNTQAINSSGAAARNARQAAGNFSAGQNGTSGLTSGVTKQINASIDSSAANSLATNQNQITQANYATGQNNYWKAVGGMQALSGEENPTAFSSQAGSNLSENFSQDSKINDEINAQRAAIAGGVVSLAADAATAGAAGIGNLDTTGGSTGLEQTGNFFQGVMSGLGGK
jgi:hypothetical protein